MDNRFEALEAWIRESLGSSNFDIVPVSGDASLRRYFRVCAHGTRCMAMDASPDSGAARRYIEVANRFGALGLNVPQVLDQALEQGFLLISDLGEELYLDRLRPATADRLYGDALGALLVLQVGTFCDERTGDGRGGSGAGTLPEYDGKLLRREMELFREWYLGRHLGHVLSPRQQAVLDQAFERLTGSALEQPRVWVHRDYHSRNLVVTAFNNPGILDFQDAVLGPVTYDLVSLLRDCYIAWPRDRVEDWVLGYHELALQSGVLAVEDEAVFLRWFNLMGIQRHLKAAGIFARLSHRDGRPDFLDDIPRTLAYIAEVSARYPEFAALRALLHDLRLPGVAA